jgi:hypothetical protein
LDVNAHTGNKECTGNSNGGNGKLKELLFNLADFKPENMGFRVACNVNDIDIGKLDNPSSIRIHHDSLLSMNAIMQGKNLSTGQNLTFQVLLLFIRLANSLPTDCSKVK